jgi:hypothetical protein
MAQSLVFFPFQEVGCAGFAYAQQGDGCVKLAGRLEK